MSRVLERICTDSLGKYKDLGFTAFEDDDHSLILEHEGRFVTAFNSTKTSLEKIQEACHQHLNEDIFSKKVAMDYMATYEDVLSGKAHE